MSEYVSCFHQLSLAAAILFLQHIRMHIHIAQDSGGGLYCDGDWCGAGLDYLDREKSKRHAREQAEHMVDSRFS